MMANCNHFNRRGTKPVCYGTKEMEVCSCGGDMSQCDFYPEKREQTDTAEVRLINANAYAFPGDLINEPTIDAMPIVHGYWIPYSTTMMECSVCKRHAPRHRYEFCPHCAAMIDGGVNNGKTKKPKIDPADDDFGAVLNCAVRYACGRETYMPGLVIDFITPLIPELDNRTLWCFDQDLTEEEFYGGYGDPRIDEPKWRQFHEAVRAERAKRGETLYKSWRTNYVK